MSTDLKKLTEKNELKHYCEPLSIDQLERAHEELLVLISERKSLNKDRELKRKGDRVLDDMRGLMAKAGISMSEFQAALERI